jgi:hypothetical protein
MEVSALGRVVISTVIGGGDQGVMARLRRLPAEEDTPVTLTTDWGMPLDLMDEHMSTPKN